MPEYLHPGVYLEELAAHPKPIEGVSTSTGGPLPVDPLRRLNFFAGQLLGAGDLQAEQDYQRDRLRRHALALHGSGIVRGLEVRLEDDDCAQSTQVHIGSGVGVDPLGELLVLPVGVVRALPPATDEPLYVTLRLWEQPCDPTPGPDETVVHARIEEACIIGIGSGVPPQALVLAVLQAQQRLWRIAPGRSGGG
ncbi:MAG: hypothetical protein JNK55_06365 [Rubrivivax sp.]|nr:hypothetical protein [Rubrivivax sp.]